MASGNPGFLIGFPQLLNVNFVVINVAVAMLVSRAFADDEVAIRPLEELPVFGTRRHCDGATAEDADIARRSC
jgi:hypothetical protein